MLTQPLHPNAAGVRRVTLESQALRIQSTDQADRHLTARLWRRLEHGETCIP